MRAIFYREVSSFFSSVTGYLSVIVFLVFISLVMWVFPGQFNVLDSGYATLDALFILAPWAFLFLIPAITMRSFSEEYKSGTIELLLTRPVSCLKLILGKYFAALLLVLIFLIPTLLFYFSVYLLGNPVGNIDSGGTWGSFIGLFFLASAYVAIGIFASTLTDNQIVSFILAIVISLAIYTGLDSVASLSMFSSIKYLLVLLGMSEHYASMSRGVIDSRDVIYFVSVSAIFIALAEFTIQKRR